MTDGTNFEVRHSHSADIIFILRLENFDDIGWKRNVASIFYMDPTLYRGLYLSLHGHACA